MDNVISKLESAYVEKNSEEMIVVYSLELMMLNAKITVQEMEFVICIRESANVMTDGFWMIVP